MALFAQEITRSLKRYDRELFCEPDHRMVLCVYRRSKRAVPVIDTAEMRLLALVEDKQFVCALTDNWTRKGTPRAWGMDFILTRLRELDLQANERLIDEMDAANERIDDSIKRDKMNEVEAFFADNRRAFAKATDDVLIHSLSKDEPRKRKLDRSIKNGNYQPD